MSRLVKRFVVFVLGVQFLAVGIVLNTKTGLGVAAFASVFCEMSAIYGMSLGMASFLLYLVFIAIQLVLLRRASLSLPSVLLQIPFSFALGFLTDMYDALIPFENPSLVEAFVMLVPALVVTSWGVYSMVQCNLVVAPVEGIVNAFARLFKVRFGTVKNCLDIAMIVISATMCLVLCQPITCIGIGTVISAVALGRLIALYEKKINLFGETDERTKRGRQAEKQSV